MIILTGDGNVRIWKDYTVKGKQKLVTAFSSIQGHKPGVRSLNAVVDWQQQSGYLVCFLMLLYLYGLMDIMSFFLCSYSLPTLFFYIASMPLVSYHPLCFGISIRSSLLILFILNQTVAFQHW